jgi:hypothetical protein
MTRQKYRSHQGRMIDMGALILKNESVRAVGNMGVNARGDRLDADNRPIDTRTQKINRQYRRQTTNVEDTPVLPTRAAVAPAPTRAPALEPQEVPGLDVAAPVDAAVDEPAPVADADSIPQGGLAQAIARARTQGRQK